MGESVRTGCCVRFSLSRPVLQPDVLLVRWRADQQDHSGHDGIDAEEQGGSISAWPPWVSSAAKLFATAKLQLGIPKATILKENRARIRQACPTDEALAQNKQLQRDYHMTPKDLANLELHVSSKTWRLAGDAATSVHIWAQENPGNVYLYQQQQSEGGRVVTPFIIGVMTPWQQEQLLQRRDVLLMDATFGTNSNKYPLFTIMGLDEARRGFPGAWAVLGAGETTANIVTFLRAFRKRMREAQPDWAVRAIMVDCSAAEIEAIGEVFAVDGTRVLICHWHVLRAVSEQLILKVKGATASADRNAIMADFQALLHLNLGASADRNEMDAAVVQAFQAMYKRWEGKYPLAMSYIRTHYQPKAMMLVEGYRNFSHGNISTTSHIEAWHGVEKGKMAVDRARLVGRRPDWLIDYLAFTCEPRFRDRLGSLRAGLMRNVHGERTVAASAKKAAKILDTSVQLSSDGTRACIRSCSRPDVSYEVSRESCSCTWAARGNICKHQVKLLFMTCGVNAGLVVRYLGTRMGWAKGGGLHALLRYNANLPTAAVQEPPLGAAGSQPSLQPSAAVAARSTASSAAGHNQPFQLAQRPAEDPQARLAATLAEVENLCMGNPSLAEAAAARVDSLLPGLRNLSMQLQQERQSGSQHPATLLAEPLQQLDPDRPFTLKRGEKAIFGGRSKVHSKKARVAAAEPAAAAAAGPSAKIEPFRAPAQRAVPSKRKTIAAALSARSAKENLMPAASMVPLQHANTIASMPAVRPQQPHAATGTAPSRPAGMPSNGYDARSVQSTAATAGTAGSAQRSMADGTQLGSASLFPLPGGTAVPGLGMATTPAMLPGAVASCPLGPAAGPLGAAATSAPLRGQALLSLALSTAAAAGFYPSDVVG